MVVPLRGLASLEDRQNFQQSWNGFAGGRTVSCTEKCGGGGSSTTEREYSTAESKECGAGRKSAVQEQAGGAGGGRRKCTACQERTVGGIVARFHGSCVFCLDDACRRQYNLSVPDEKTGNTCFWAGRTENKNEIKKKLCAAAGADYGAGAVPYSCRLRRR